MLPVKKHAAFPAIIARRIILVTSDFLEGAKALNAPSKIPIDPKLAKPHKAYVETTSERSC